ncbi:hypothetical protein HBN50_10770 [Halobacteriovorax sp. GB3]|uniref:hypothetical protein n=1 Tax=Halobacteriovorax sp. GB3 TaxID=2719615 RepID=UPI0023625017|nr:hypothetical protein [Halobacteriovorax sp. GB3]MDD0853585.1 hypothetical protein [Halobacteriovorax sp. GB3]
MKLFVSLMTIILLSVFVSSCGKSPQEDHSYESQAIQEQLKGTMNLNKLDLNVELTWLKGPFGDPAFESSFLMIVRDNKGEIKSLDPKYHFYINAWMPSMGHGSAYDGDTEQSSTGVYLHRDLYFNMPGDWEVYIDVYEGEELIDSTKLRIDL